MVTGVNFHSRLWAVLAICYFRASIDDSTIQMQKNCVRGLTEAKESVNVEFSMERLDSTIHKGGFEPRFFSDRNENVQFFIPDCNEG